MVNGELPTTHRQHFDELLLFLQDDELEWYEWEVWKNIRWFFGLGILSIILSLAASVVAATRDGSPLPAKIRLALIVLPILSTALGGIAQLFRFREKEALREDGRIELKDIIETGKSLRISAKTEDDFRAAVAAVQDRFHRLEFSQHRGYVSLHTDRHHPPSDANGRTPSARDKPLRSSRPAKLKLPAI